LTNVVAIDAGRSHTVALKSDGTVVAWGVNSNGQLNVPPGLTGVVAIAAGTVGTAALKSTGEIVSWGYAQPPPSGLTNVVGIAMGYEQTLALKGDGTVVAWSVGFNDGNVPPGLTGVTAIAAGVYKSLAVKSDGTVVAWGANGSVPAGLTNVVAVAAGAGHNLALKNDTTITGWGRNAHGQTTIPAGLRGVRAIAANGSDSNFDLGHSVALTDSTVGFGNQSIGTASVAKTFTIKNTGTAPLTISGVSVNGGQAANFTVNTSGMLTTVPVNGQTTFRVTFTPSSLGAKQTTLRVLNNDSDEGSFYIRLTGVGINNNAPTINAATVTRQQGSPAANAQVATVQDAEDAENTLTVRVEGGTTATENGVTVSNLVVSTTGQVTARVVATCTASNANFTLTVTDSAGATANATLNVTVTANAAPTVGTYPNTLLAPGGSTTVIPAAAPADNGSIASVTATATPNFFTGTLTANTATGAVTITNANPVGGYTITVAVKDNCGATTTRSFMLTVSTCGASLSKTGQNFAANGGTGNFTVTIDGACTWTAVSNNPSFITIVSPQGQQAGSRTVSFSVAGHSNATPRSGTITVAGQTFLVRQGAQFLDVPVGAPLYEEIGKLSAVGVTQGCGNGNYCPEPAVTREQMAVFLIRALGDFNPPAPGAQRFADVPSTNPFYAFIEQMAVRGITSGCGGGNYCPTANVTREQMAAFIIRALHNPGYVPPMPGTQRFADVPSSNPFYGHIEEMAVRQITLGCGGGNYCPTANVTRGQMAAFLVRAFGL
jgi:hypothetical protein